MAGTRPAMMDIQRMPPDQITRTVVPMFTRS